MAKELTPLINLNNLNIDLNDNISEMSFPDEGEDELTKLHKRLKIQKEQITMLKQQKTMEEYKSKIIKEDYDKLDKDHKLLQDENIKNLNIIDILKKELNDYKEKSSIKKLKGKF